MLLVLLRGWLAPVAATPPTIAMSTLAGNPSALFEFDSASRPLSGSSRTRNLTRGRLSHPLTVSPPSEELSDLLERSLEQERAAQPAEPAPTPEPPLPGTGPSMAGTLVVTTRHLDLYVGRSTFSAGEIKAISDDIEEALEQAEKALGTELLARTSLAFYRPSLRPMAGVRGLTYSDVRRIEMFYDPYESSWRAVAIAAHELGHQLEADRYGDEVQSRADTILHEGLATWLAGERWLEMRDASSWRHRGYQLLDEGRLLSLLRDPHGAASNDAYDGWASFVDYLISTYGMEAFDDLYRSSRGRSPGSARYSLIYGAALDELAQDWRAWLRDCC